MKATIIFSEHFLAGEEYRSGDESPYQSEDDEWSTSDEDYEGMI